MSLKQNIKPGFPLKEGGLVKANISNLLEEAEIGLPVNNRGEAEVAVSSAFSNASMNG